MGRRKESTTVYFNPGTLARLEALRLRTSAPTAVRIRQAVEEWLARNEPPPPEGRQD